MGKTTLINRLLDGLKPCIKAGFRTSGYERHGRLYGYFMQGISTEWEDPVIRCIGRGGVAQAWVPVVSTFEDYGVKILTGALLLKPGIIIMDELGFFENEAYMFQDAVRKVLDSNIPVLGVLRKKSTPFLDSIASRGDVELLTVLPSRRNKAYCKLKIKLEKILEGREQ